MPAAGTGWNSTSAPTPRSASASASLCANGTCSSAVPCEMWNGGAPACTCSTGLAARAASGSSAAGAPIHRASRVSSARFPHVVLGHREQVGGAEPVHDAADIVAAQTCQRGERRAGRHSPEHDARCIHSVLGAVRVQPRERGIHVVQLRGKARLAAQPVFARGDGEPRRDDAVERLRIADARREHLAAAAQPPPAVQEHDEGCAGGIRVSAGRATAGGTPPAERSRSRGSAFEIRVTISRGTGTRA